jgi:Predicted metal binding domain
MLVDPIVCLKKYDAEVKLLADKRVELERHGLFVLKESAFPIIDVLCVPRHPVQFLLPGFAPQPTPAVAGGFQVQFSPVAIPHFAARSFKARFDLTDFDVLPPSFELRDFWTDELLPPQHMAQAMQHEEVRGIHPVLLNGHPSTMKPFLCLRGIREYHTHPQHSGDDWFLYRADMNLFSTLLLVWRVIIDLPIPQVMLLQNQARVMWGAQEKP